MFPGAELDELGTCLGGGHVPGALAASPASYFSSVIGVTDSDLANQQVSPVRALAAVPRQSLEQRCQGVALPDGHEVDGGVVQVAAAIDGRAGVLNVWRAVLAELGHDASLAGRRYVPFARIPASEPTVIGVSGPGMRQSPHLRRIQGVAVTATFSCGAGRAARRTSRRRRGWRRRFWRRCALRDCPPSSA